MKTVFVLYMLTLIQGQSPQVTKLDTFDSFSHCIKTADELRDFYKVEKVIKYNAGQVVFKCIEKKFYNEVVDTGE